MLHCFFSRDACSAFEAVGDYVDSVFVFDAIILKGFTFRKTETRILII